MNFLKIALSNGLKNNSFNSWQTTNLNDNPQASELAAIVVADTDQDSLKTVVVPDFWHYRNCDGRSALFIEGNA